MLAPGTPTIVSPFLLSSLETSLPGLQALAWVLHSSVCFPTTELIFQKQIVGFVFDAIGSVNSQSNS